MLLNILCTQAVGSPVVIIIQYCICKAVHRPQPSSLLLRSIFCLSLFRSCQTNRAYSDCSPAPSGKAILVYRNMDSSLLTSPTLKPSALFTTRRLHSHVLSCPHCKCCYLFPLAFAFILSGLYTNCGPHYLLCPRLQPFPTLD